jgi:signal transduction histidine kinase
VTHPRPHGRSPTPALLFGLIITLATVVAYSAYITAQVSGLQRLQSDLVDRNRRDSLLLLRIQNDLNQLALAMRDMLDSEGPYPLTAWSAQFDRIRVDLDDALRREEELGVGRRTAEQTHYLSNSVAQFWDAVNRIFDLARGGRENEARTQIRLSLQARQAALSTAIARLLVQNNENEERTAQQVRDIYAQVHRQVYWFLTATLVAIAGTSLYLIRANRRLFGQLATLSDERRGLAQQLIATRESTLHEISRELHDQFGQILTAIGSMLGRAGRQAPEGSPLRSDLREMGEIAQAALDNVRGLSQTLHPSILEELGLESTIEWYLSTIEKQLGIHMSYERSGPAVPVDSTVGIHVYRVLQESVNNIVRHSGAKEGVVRLRFDADTLELDVEDRGTGLDPDPARRGLGLVAMRERAELLGGTIEFLRPRDGGTLVRLRVPIGENREGNLAGEGDKGRI